MRAFYPNGAKTDCDEVSYVRLSQMFSHSGDRENTTTAISTVPSPCTTMTSTTALSKAGRASQQFLELRQEVEHRTPVKSIYDYDTPSASHEPATPIPCSPQSESVNVTLTDTPVVDGYDWVHRRRTSTGAAKKPIEKKKKKLAQFVDNSNWLNWDDWYP